MSPAAAARARIVAASVFAAAAFGAPVWACDPVAEIRYVEAAPFDRLILSNFSAGGWSMIGAEIDLGPSVGALVLDTEPGAPGAGSSYPFRPVGDGGLIDADGLNDGSRKFSLSFEGVGAGRRAVFALDLDDTLPTGSTPTRIVGSEIAGAAVSARLVGPNGVTVSLDGVLDETGAARMAPKACV